MRRNWTNASGGYGLLPIALHWLMLLLIAAAYATMELKSIFPKGSPGREAMAGWHYFLGMSVFLLAWLRFIANLAGSEPRIEPALPAWQARLARAMHLALYALMIGVPVFGWLTLGAKGTEVSYLGVNLPVLIGKSQGAAKWLKDIHEAFATTGYVLVGLHATAALYHHYVMRDNTLRLMWTER
jgi:superoxide oxidase